MAQALDILVATHVGAQCGYLPQQCLPALQMEAFHVLGFIITLLL